MVCIWEQDKISNSGDWEWLSAKWCDIHFSPSHSQYQASTRSPGITRVVTACPLLSQFSSLSEEVRLVDHWADLGRGRAGCRGCSCCSRTTALSSAAEADEAGDDQQQDENADNDSSVGLDLKWDRINCWIEIFQVHLFFFSTPFCRRGRCQEFISGDEVIVSERQWICSKQITPDRKPKNS